MASSFIWSRRPLLVSTPLISRSLWPLSSFGSQELLVLAVVSTERQRLRIFLFPVPPRRHFLSNLPENVCLSLSTVSRPSDLPCWCLNVLLCRGETAPLNPKSRCGHSGWSNREREDHACDLHCLPRYTSSTMTYRAPSVLIRSWVGLRREHNCMHPT